MLTLTERAAERALEYALSLLCEGEARLLLEDPDYQQFTIYCKLRRDIDEMPYEGGSPAFESFKRFPNAATPA